MAENPSAAELASLVDGIIEDYRARPVDLLHLNDGPGEHRYLSVLKSTYLRTLADVCAHVPRRRADGGPARILEVGAFLGVVSTALARLGYSVTTEDIPEFAGNPRLRARFQEAGIRSEAVNLRDYRQPFEDATFDAVVMCEVIEHLNFNPLPVLKELNRILRPDGVLYLAQPNLAWWSNRLRLLRGRSYRNPIDDYAKQLDRTANMIVALHWREHTAAETREMLGITGFEVVHSYFFDHVIDAVHPLKRLALHCLYAFAPSMRPNQVAVAVRRQPCRQEFWISPSVDFRLNKSDA
ncbi:MAG: class I SAM-dependent methyltransferase [Verrucomicrobiales bacterium]|nr:class I SAM-dependent methyltransferase [Verrucomicrobiales bacterium]